MWASPTCTNGLNVLTIPDSSPCLGEVGKCHSKSRITIMRKKNDLANDAGTEGAETATVDSSSSSKITLRRSYRTRGLVHLRLGFCH